MTVTSSVARNDYLGNGGVALYAFTFEVLGVDDFSVYRINTENETTTLTRGSDYTVALNTTTRTGTITLMAGALASGFKLAIVDNQPLTQLVDLEASNKYPPSTIEQALDRVSMQLRTLNEQVRHCVRLPPGESASAQVMPLVAARANRYLAFDVNGQPTTQGAPLLTGITVSAYVETLLNDLSATEARTTLGLGSLATLTSITQANLASDVQNRVDTIAALKALTVTYATVMVLGYYVAGDGGGGIFRWDGASSAADNGGTIIIPTAAPANGRWIRQVVGGTVNVREFGAKGDGATNDTVAIQAAIDFSVANGMATVAPYGTFIVLPATAQAGAGTYNTCMPDLMTSAVL